VTITAIGSTMNLEEHAAKALVLAPAGVAVPRGRLRANTGEASEAAAEIGSCVVEENPASRRSCTATGRDREI
jgi:succinyl-CoA synthetase beta subunit